MKIARLASATALTALLAGGTCFAEVTPKAIEAEVNRAVEAFDLTGVAITVVSRDAVIYRETRGIRDVRHPDVKIDENTLLPFASIGKAFTTTALAMMVEEGKLDWDDPVRTFIPEFEMSDPYITAEFSVRDLVTHRSGLPLGAGDLLIVPDAKPRVSDILAAMKHIPPSTSFRSEYAYDNLLYIIAGEIVSRIEGRPWADVIESRIFEPLDMRSCTALPSEAAASDNVITQHLRRPGSRESEPVDPRYIMGDASAPAGGLSCSITDLAKWAQFWLNDAKSPDGTALLSEAQLKEVWSPVTPQNVDGLLSSLGNTHFSLYGLGWVLRDIHGKLMVSHSGGLLGATSYFGILPEEDVAVFVVSNDFTPASSALALQILSDAAGPEAGSDWIGTLADYYGNQQETAKSDAGLDETAPADEPVEPARPLVSYTGTYIDPWYGPVTVDFRNGALHLDMSRSEVLDAPLVPVGEDKFVARWPDRNLNADAYVIFSSEADAVTGMTMEPVSETTDFSFDFGDLNFTRQE